MQIQNQVRTIQTAIQDIPDDAIHYMMHNCADIPTFSVFQRTCTRYYNALTNNVFGKIENFKKTHPLDFKVRLPLSMLRLSAYKDATTPSTDGLLRTVDVTAFSHFSPQELADELPEMDFRYKKLQSIYDQLFQGLAVFMPSLQAFGFHMRSYLIAAIKVTPTAILLYASYLVVCEIFTPYSSCKMESEPCTYWEATEKCITIFLKACTLWKRLTIVLMNFMAQNHLAYGIITSVALTYAALIPAQIALFRTAATATLASLAKDLGY